MSEAERYVPEDPDVEFWEASYYALTHEREKAESVLAQLRALPETFVAREHYIATVYALLGALDQCFAWLERGFQKKAFMRLRFRRNPHMARIRDDPRFHDLLRRAHLA